MASDDNLIGVIFGFGAGLFVFFKGFRIFRKYRVLADTPLAEIRSIAMGLVEVYGKAKGEERLVSPVSRSPCFLYKIDIERWEKDSKGRGRWSHHRTDVNGVKFHVEDATGKVLVDAYDAELDLPRCAQREIGGGWTGHTFHLFKGTRPAALAGSVPTESELASYVAGGGIATPVAPPRFSKDDAPQVRQEKARTLERFALSSLKSAFLGGGLRFGGSSSGRYRLSEYCILPDHWYDVTGTCAENPRPKDEYDRNIIVKGENEPTFLISSKSEKELEKSLRWKALLYVFGGAAVSLVCLAIMLNEFGLL